MKLNFREATVDDAEQVRQHIEAAFRASDTRQDWTADMGLGATFRQALEPVLKSINNPDGAILLAFDDAENLIGSVDVSKRPEDVARIAMLSIATDAQQGGLGRQVLGYAEGYAQRVWGAKKASLNALCTREKLIDWYIRRGYEKTGETTPFPVSRVEDLVLPEDLCFVEMEKNLV